MTNRRLSMTTGIEDTPSRALDKQEAIRDRDRRFVIALGPRCEGLVPIRG